MKPPQPIPDPPPLRAGALSFNELVALRRKFEAMHKGPPPLVLPPGCRFRHEGGVGRVELPRRGFCPWSFAFGVAVVCVGYLLLTLWGH